jgi:hypothetical protein
MSPIGAWRAPRLRSEAVKRTLRHVGTGAAALALIHAALLGLSRGDGTYVDPGRLGSADVLSGVHSVAPWIVAAVTLLWLAHRRSAIYARTAIALLLSSSAGMVFAASASVQGLTLPEQSFVRAYLALPGALVGWYSLMALALTAGLTAPRPRIAVMVIALSVVAVSVADSDHPGLSTLWSAGVPLVAWLIAGRVQRPAHTRRGAADAWEPGARPVPLRPRGGVTARRPAPHAVPLRKAG